jgi:hypothetical protein
MKKKYYVIFSVVAIVEGTAEKVITCEPGEFASKFTEAKRAIEGRTKRVLEHVTKGEKYKHAIVNLKYKSESS